MEELNSSVQKAAAGAVVTGGCAFVGGLAGGPVGMAAGGAVGGIASASLLKFPSARKVVQEWAPPERTALMERAKQGLTGLIELGIKLFFRILKEFRNFKSLEDFTLVVLNPIIGELVSYGVTWLVKLLKFAFA